MKTRTVSPRVADRAAVCRVRGWAAALSLFTLLAACAGGPRTSEPGARASRDGAPTLAAPSAPLEAELREILALLPGRYTGPGTGGPMFHKIVPIVAPQFGGDTVFYHQISRDGFDSTAPSQQKIYVFDRAPDRSVNLMRSYVFLPKQGYANLEQDAAALRSVQPSMLMNFPIECAIRWSRGEAAGQFVARVRPEHCSFQGVAFKQRISPEMTYVIDRDSFSIEDVLYGENGQPLFPRTGLLRAARTRP